MPSALDSSSSSSLAYTHHECRNQCYMYHASQNRSPNRRMSVHRWPHNPMMPCSRHRSWLIRLYRFRSSDPSSAHNRPMLSYHSGNALDLVRCDYSHRVDLALDNSTCRPSRDSSSIRHREECLAKKKEQRKQASKTVRVKNSRQNHVDQQSCQSLLLLFYRTIISCFIQCRFSHRVCGFTDQSFIHLQPNAKGTTNEYNNE